MRVQQNHRSPIGHHWWLIAACWYPPKGLAGFSGLADWQEASVGHANLCEPFAPGGEHDMIAARLTDDSWYGRDLWWTLLVIKIPKPYWLHFWDDPTPNNTTTKETEHG